MFLNFTILGTSCCVITSILNEGGGPCGSGEKEKYNEENTHRFDNGRISHVCIPDLLSVLLHGLSSCSHDKCWVHSSLYRKAIKQNHFVAPRNSHKCNYSLNIPYLMVFYPKLSPQTFLYFVLRSHELSDSLFERPLVVPFLIPS